MRRFGANDVKALAAMWRGGAFLLNKDTALRAARFDDRDIGTSIRGSEVSRPQAHPQVKMLVRKARPRREQVAGRPAR